ncbi:pentatricopeptide repeat-containing protein At5g13770, chloroplastic [Oryza glaberrima]|uniref:Pentacotripeptide-repeat region of PRORP domain-containing protein n=2 Tax=Oryza TaxID=4527 RepID=A0A0D3FZD9_9ORYZ|nr:pentatricopeptide repeat-containing protein At5g13770, chloroplastic [Oryza glaberrima]XP_052152795.1 pentatricopeptide repeat-containing protein At5g13770, chloroplastic [Oryza glaberrima]
MAKCYSEWPPLPPLHPPRRTPSQTSLWTIRRQLASFVLHCSRSCASPLLEPKNLPDEFHAVSASTPAPVPVPVSPLPDAPKLGISNKFIRGLCSDRQTEQLAFECYRRALHQPEFLPDKKTMNALTVQLLRAKQWSSLEFLVEDFRAYGVMPERRTCARLVASCVKARKFGLADMVLGVLEGKRGAPAAVAFSSAMQAYNKLHMYRSTLLVYERMRAARLSRDADAYRAVMAACGALGKPEMVASLLKQYKSHKWYPSESCVETYAIVCDALGRAGRASDALKCLREMEADGIAPNATIYSSTIRSLADAHESSAAEDLYNEAWKKGMLGDPDMFLKVIVMHVEAGRVEKTMGVAKDMRETGLRVTDCILSTIVNGFVKRRGLKPAIRAYDKLIALGCEPGQVTYASVINVYCQLGRSDRAESVFSEMIDRGFDKCVVAYGNMISMYGKISRASDAMRLLAVMKKKGCEPNIWVYNSLLDMHGRLGNSRQAEKIWKEMMRRKIQPDRISYTAIINAFNRSGELDRCMDLYQEFRETGGKVDTALAGLMVGVFSKCSRFNELIELLKDMQGTRLDRRLYLTVLRSLRDAGLEVHVKWLQTNFSFVEEKT